MIESYVRGDGCVVCAPLGELDWMSSMALRHLFDDVLVPGAAVEVDLGGVNFVDAVGLSALVGGVRRARLLGAIVDVRNPRRQVRRQLQLVGIEPMMRLGALAESDGHDAA